MYDDVCARSEIRDRCFKKANHFSAYINRGINNV